MERLGITLNAAFETFDSVDIVAQLEANELPFAKINTRSEVVHDPQVVAMGSLLEFEYVIAGPMRQARPPGRFSETPAEIFRQSPELGEHTREVLAQAGLSSQQIEDLRQRKITR